MTSKKRIFIDLIKNKFAYRLRKNFYLRRGILLFVDLSVLLICIQYLLHTNQLILNISPKYFYLCSFSFSIFFYIILGQYKSLTRYFGRISIYKLIFRNFILSIVFYLFCLIYDIASLNILGCINFSILLSSLMVFIKNFMKEILLQNISLNKNSKLLNVAIYGAGSAGVQLSSNLSNNYNIEFFIDDNPNINGREIDGIKIISKNEFPRLYMQIDRVLLAIPSLSKGRKKTIYDYLKKYNLPILEVPSLDELSSGAYKINSLRSINLDDLLGREITYADNSLLQKSSKNRTIFISGAGGSIGTELCNQIVKLLPNRLILLDHNEYSLYSVIEKIKPLVNKKNINLIPLLGSACDFKLIEKIFRIYEIDLVFHCAAYKQVPLVEVNALEGIRNNVFSTHVICENALKNNIKEVMFVSTDKAVRPTSIMGASKRLAELIVQSFAIESNEKISKTTLFSMVRFGNVLGSSGSVVPLFKKQIELGGPITLTHPDIIRYFMSIEEAAQLVLQASVLAKGGDVFLLDMGKPVKIIDLAKEMIRLSGYQVKDENNPNGDIEISISGLRSGEKLYEELLINAKSENTSHKLIYRAKERYIRPEILFKKIIDLKHFIEEKDIRSTFEILKEMVPEWSYDKSKEYDFEN